MTDCASNTTHALDQCGADGYVGCNGDGDSSSEDDDGDDGSSWTCDDEDRVVLVDGCADCGSAVNASCDCAVSMVAAGNPQLASFVDGSCASGVKFECDAGTLYMFQCVDDTVWAMPTCGHADYDCANESPWAPSDRSMAPAAAADDVAFSYSYGDDDWADGPCGAEGGVFAACVMQAMLDGATFDDDATAVSFSYSYADDVPQSCAEVAPGPSITLADAH